MLSKHIVRLPFIRRVCTLNVYACVQGKIRGGIAGGGGGIRTNPTKRTFYCMFWNNNNKMLQSFEERVFQNVISSGMGDYNDNSKIATQPVETVEKSLSLPHGVGSQTNGTLSCAKVVQNKLKNSYESNGHKEQLQCGRDYEEAVKALNTLQSNAESLRSSLNVKRINSLQDTEKYLNRSGLSVKDLEALSVIHVAGTKGKGSTCALTESILRHYGVKTGFFSSPHLVSLTERIRLNGQPISKEKFVKYFWRVYDKLLAQQEYENDMPAYFKFLTILSFHIYLMEQVDVVILEVGIGGELDCTNVVPNTKTVGITSLGLEHTQLLGNTLQEIAWQKAGIIKPKSTVYTSVTQPECLEVIKERTKEKNSQLHIVPALQTYFENNEKHHMLKDNLNSITLLNGSLALQLAYDWLRQNRKLEMEINKALLTEQAVRGLLNCNWPGRCQVVKFFNLNMHLDGAHTLESMQVCGEWFAKVTKLSKQPKILIFNTTGNRDSRLLQTILRKYANFDLVCFVPNISTSASANHHDTQSVLHTQVEQLKRAQMHLENWRELCQESGQPSTAMTFTSVLSSFQHILKVYHGDKPMELNILVTGSIHLIGAAILSLNELCKELKDNEN